VINEVQKEGLYILALKERYWFFISGTFVGQAIFVLITHILIGQLTPFILYGVFMLMGALGSYQYSNYLKDKIKNYLEGHRK